MLGYGWVRRLGGSGTSDCNSSTGCSFFSRKVYFERLLEFFVRFSQLASFGCACGTSARTLLAYALKTSETRPILKGASHSPRMYPPSRLRNVDQRPG